MIATIQEAADHCKHVLNNADFVLVLPDGHIYLSKTQVEQDLISEKNDGAFIVKGQPKEKKPKRTKE